MKAASIAQSVSQALGQASQIGVSGSLTPVVYATQDPGINVAQAPIKVPAYKKNNNYTTNLASATRQVLSSGGAPGLVAGAVTGAVARTVINNFTQNNTSPKALSRTEIYRDSKNFWSLVTGGQSIGSGSTTTTRGGRR